MIQPVAQPVIGRLSALSIIPAVLFLAIGFVAYRWATRGILQIDYLKMLFGFTLLVIVSSLALGIIAGRIEEEHSYGLIQIITLLSVMSGAFVQWAFSSAVSKSRDDDQSKH